MTISKKVPLLLLAAALIVGFLWTTSRAVTPKSATWHDVKMEAEKGEYRLITTDELWNRYTQDPEGTLLVDAREKWDHLKGHIKGSINFPMRSTSFSRKQRTDALAAVLGPDKDIFVAFY
jgi:hypothetical protein